MSAKRGVAVQILGQEYRIKSDGSADQIRRAAELLTETMEKLRGRSSTIDTLDNVILAALNIANRYLSLRDDAAGDGRVEDAELESLIALVESAVAETGAAPH